MAWMIFIVEDAKAKMRKKLGPTRQQVAVLLSEAAVPMAGIGHMKIGGLCHSIDADKDG